jgi:Protein of unknown function (DUF3306)
MSTADENVFARWSRRKQAARKTEAVRQDEAADAAASPIGEADPLRSDQQLLAAETGDIEPPKPLPSLDELTAQSDLTAFLREGVPEFLKNAALRKMWSLDPAIRDHVGLAECSWDFNQPGSVPGFGPMGATRSLPDFLTRPAAPDTADPEPAVSSARSPGPAPTSIRRNEPVDVPDMPPPEERVVSDPLPGPGAEADEGPGETEHPVAVRRHGALPRDPGKVPDSGGG